MATFEVKVEDAKYDVDAPDERTAWAWANQMHQQYKQSLSGDVAKMRSQGAIGRAGSGARASVQNAAYGIKDIFTDLSPEERRAVDVNKRFLDEDTAGKVGGFAADVASFALPGGLAAKGITKGLTLLPRAAQFAAGVGANAAVDAGLSAAYSTGDKFDAAKDGALGSVGGQVAGRLLGKTLGGLVTPSEEAARMMKRGVVPTIGQAADQETFSGRAIRRAEEASQSLPIIGDLISRSRNRAVKEGMQAATQFSDEALDAYRSVPGVQALPKNLAGDDLLRIVNSNASAVYDDALSRAGNLNVGSVPTLNGVNISQLAFSEAASRGVDDASIQKFIKNTVLPKVQNGAMDGPTWKKIDSMLGKNAAAFRASADGDKRLIGDTYKQLQVFWRELLEAKSSPDIKEQVSAANTAWAKMLPLEKAAASGSARKAGGVFTGGQLQNAVRDLDRSRFDRSSRYNPSELAQYSDDASAVLGTSLNNSGTAERLLYGGLLSGGGYSLGVLPQLAGGAAATGIAYTRPGQKFLLGGYSRQKAIEEALRRRNGYFGDVGAAILGE